MRNTPSCTFTRTDARPYSRRSAGVTIYRGWSKDELGELAGKPAVAVLSVTDPNIVAGVAQILADAEPVEKERQGREQD